MKRATKKEIERRLFSIYGIFASLPFLFHKTRIAPPREVSHGQWPDHLPRLFDKPGMRVLEIGSRNVTGANFRDRFARAEYVGFDFYDGENVDVVGDAHRLGSYFREGERFDLIFSSAVFEHLCMPWIVAQEITKMLKVGGHVFVETHFSFSSHERPWNFFQFSDMGLRALFNPGLGYTFLDGGMSNPMGGYFAPGSERYLRYRPVREMYCHSEVFCRKDREVEGFSWEAVEIDEIVQGTRYPTPQPPKR
ncbi:class I SAM-dependent methyltransferase [Oceaniglobus roseus]|uniref:class I SAM-dependent methyltransferase n=1 Tax=Oceaniglobus roseus TaxID=1737570 RepID=UPI001C129C10|nr:class I SAM-dependent methyltransferase [Kandeliimicrobium roseum]